DFHVTGVQTCALPIFDSRSAPHWTTSRVEPDWAERGARTKYLTSRMRDVLSARSSMRPSSRKCHGSPCDRVASVTPMTWWLERRSEERRVGKRSGPHR